MVSNKKTSMYIILALLFFIITTFPFVYMVLQSFADWSLVDKVFIPTEFTLDSYKFLFSGGGSGGNIPWGRAFFNSAFVSLMTTFIAIAIGMLVSYAVVKLRFKGSTKINGLILLQMFFPTIIILVPLYMVTKFLGIENTYLGMILPKALNTWAIFMYINYFRNIPEELLEAARIDGCSEFGVLRKIVFPNVKSITTILFLFIFMERWNELLWDSIVVSDQNLRTLNVLISSVSGPYASYPGALYAASVILTLPIVILFIALSKKIYEGMSYVAK